MENRRLTASSSSGNVPGQVKMFLDNIKSDDKSVYLYIPAVAAGEYYGPNTWGDYFPEESLKKHYKSFYNAKVYRGHKNSDPKKSIGDVVLSVYNDSRHRIELVVKVFRDIAKDVADAADVGKPVGFSMGCRVPYEVCSHCKGKFYKTSDRCSHLRDHMNKHLDGKLVYAVNEHPDFFDISETPKPADNTIWLIKKVASLESGEEASDEDISLSLSDLAELDILSQSINKEDIVAMSRYGLEDFVKSASSLGLYVKPEEFQYVFLSSAGRSGLADTLYDSGVTFCDYNTPLMKVADGLYDMLTSKNKPEEHRLKSRDILKGYNGRFMRPVFDRKTGEGSIKSNDAVNNIMGDISSAYLAYRGSETSKDPTSEANQASNNIFKSSSASSIAIPVAAGIGASYFASADAWRRVRQGKPVPAVEKFIAQNPAISSLVIGGATWKINKRLSSGLFKKKPITTASGAPAAAK